MLLFLFPCLLYSKLLMSHSTSLYWVSTKCWKHLEFYLQIVSTLTLNECIKCHLNIISDYLILTNNFLVYWFTACRGYYWFWCSASIPLLLTEPWFSTEDLHQTPSLHLFALGGPDSTLPQPILEQPHDSGLAYQRIASLEPDNWFNDGHMTQFGSVRITPETCLQFKRDSLPLTLEDKSL